MTTQVLFTRRSIERVRENPNHDDEYYALVVRGYPRYVGAMDSPDNPFDVYDQSLSPCSELLAEYDDRDLDAWHRAFEAEVGRDHVLDRASQLRTDAGEKTVVFCCYEPDDEDCHTYTLLDVLEDQYGTDAVHTREDLGGPAIAES